MSSNLIKAVNPAEFPPSEKAVLKEFAWFGNDNGANIFPSLSTIAQRTGYSVRGVRKICRRLEAKKVLVPVSSKRGGRRRSTHYLIDLSVLEKFTARNVVPGFSVGEHPNPEPELPLTRNGKNGNPEYRAAEKKRNQEKEKKPAESTVTLDRAFKAFSEKTKMTSTTRFDARARRMELASQLTLLSKKAGVSG